MAPLIGREVAGCAACLNFVSFVLLLIATILPTWSWGNVFVTNNILSTGNFGPWVAGQIWIDTVTVPCVCNTEGICFSTCAAAVTGAALWQNIPVEAACEPLSKVFVEWSGKLGYCQFPDGFVVPTFPPLPPGATGFGTVTGNIPSGTTFAAPQEITAVEGLIIASTVMVFFASLAGCMDATSESGERVMAVTLAALVCSFFGWALAIPTYAIWSSMSVTQSLMTAPPQVSMPIWLGSQLFAVSAQQFRYGAPWGLALAATILTFIAFAIHILALVGVGEPTFGGGGAGGGGGGGGGEPPQPVIARAGTPSATANPATGGAQDKDQATSQSSPAGQSVSVATQSAAPSPPAAIGGSGTATIPVTPYTEADDSPVKPPPPPQQPSTVPVKPIPVKPNPVKTNVASTPVGPGLGPLAVFAAYVGLNSSDNYGGGTQDPGCDAGGYDGGGGDAGGYDGGGGDAGGGYDTGYK